MKPLWNSQPDWAGDERNVVLTLSRIWYSAATGKIAPKDVCQLGNGTSTCPASAHRLKLDRLIFGQEEDRSVLRADKLEEFIHFMKARSPRCSAMMSNNAFKPMPLRGTTLTSALGVQGGILDTSFSFCFPYFLFLKFSLRIKYSIGLNGRNFLTNMKRQERF